MKYKKILLQKNSDQLEQANRKKIKHHRIGIAQSFNLHSIEWRLTTYYMPNDTRVFRKMANENHCTKQIVTFFGCVDVCICVFQMGQFVAVRLCFQ